MSLQEPKMFSGEMSSGAETSGDIRSWCEYMDRYFTLTRTREDLKFEYAMAHLEGAALHFAKRIHKEGTAPLNDPSYAWRLADVSRQLENPYAHASPAFDLDHGTWAWLKRKLIQQFESFRTTQYLRWKLDQLNQWTNRWSVERYWREFEKIASRIPDMNQQERLHVFQRGLYPNLAEKVMGAYWKVPNVEQAAAIAAEEELLRQRTLAFRGFPPRGGKTFYPRGHLAALETNPQEAESGMPEASSEDSFDEEAQMQLHAVSNTSSYARAGQATYRSGAASGGGSRGNYSSTAAAAAGRSSNRGSAAAELKCHYCLRQGHFVRECREKAADQAKGIFRANKFQPVPTGSGAAATGGRNMYSSNARGGKGQGQGQQQGKEEAHHRE